MQRIVSLLLCIFLLGSLLLSGCASRYGDQRTKVNYYPQCYQPVTLLRQDENSTGNSTAAGAVGGALLGALIGGLATGKASGAVAGAVAGGATGAVAGNIYGKSQAKNRDAAYLRQYSQQLGNEAASMNRATAAAKVASRCYDEQFKMAAAQFRAGQITRLEFQDRYNEIRSGLEETSYILNDTAISMAKKDGEYQQALAEPYTSARPVSSVVDAPKKKMPPTTAKPGVIHTADESAVTTKALQWKSSREDLENTRNDLNTHITVYDETVSNLLG